MLGGRSAAKNAERSGIIQRLAEHNEKVDKGENKKMKILRSEEIDGKDATHEELIEHAIKSHAFVAIVLTGVLAFLLGGLIGESSAQFRFQENAKTILSTVPVCATQSVK